MGFKNYQLHSGLNSFYQNQVRKKEVMKDLRDLISSLDKKQGPYLLSQDKVKFNKVDEKKIKIKKI